MSMEDIEEYEGEEREVEEKKVSLEDVPLDVLCYMIFCDFSVYWITTRIVFVCRHFYTSGWRAIVNRKITLRECCWEDYKIPSSSLCYKLVTYNVILKNDLELMRMCCSQGYTEIVKEIFHLMKPIRSEWFRSAVARNHIEIVKLFMNNPTVYELERDLECLETAVVNYNEEMALLLLKSGRVSPHYKNCLEFVLSCENGLTKVVKFLLSADSFTNPSVNQNEPIRLASKNGHTDIVLELLRKQNEQNSTGSNIFPIIDPSVDDNICIRSAASNGHVGVVEVLIFSSDVDPTSNEQECIRTASANGHTEIVSLLMKDPRVDPSVKNNQALREAASNGHFEVVELLLCSKYEHNRVEIHDFDESAFRYASRNGHLDIVRFLLKNSKKLPIDVNARDGFALSKACEFGRTEIVKFLLSIPSIKPDISSNQPLRNACKFGHYNIVRMLLRDPRIEHIDDNNNEELCNAIVGKHSQIVTLLLNDPRTDTSEGYGMEKGTEVGDLNTLKALMEHPNFRLNNPHQQIAHFLKRANSFYHYEISRYLFRHKDLKTSSLTKNEGWLFHVENMKEYDENEELTPMTPLDEKEEEEYHLSRKFEEATVKEKEEEEEEGEEENLLGIEMERGLAFADNIFQMIQKGGI